MEDKALFALAGFLVLIVTAILATGIGSFARGGEFNRRNSNRLMRWRLIAQFVAVLVILAYVSLRGG